MSANTSLNYHFPTREATNLVGVSAGISFACCPRIKASNVGFSAGPVARFFRLKPLIIQEGTPWKASLPAVLGKTRRTE
jgi:hypothetical protein